MPANYMRTLSVIVGVFFCLALQPVALGDCPSFDAGVSVGNLEQGQKVQIEEASGIAASSSNANIFWVHNDAGGSARIFAVNHLGHRVGIYKLAGAINYDYEDIAVGPGPVAKKQYIYIADTGDNKQKRSAKRSPITVYRVAEPVVDYKQDAAAVTLSKVDALPMRYPSKVYDAETLLVDPVSGDIFLVTRDRGGKGFAHVYRNPAPHVPGVLVTLELVASFACRTEIKGGAMSPAGDMVILRPHSKSRPTDALLWMRSGKTDLGEVFSKKPCTVSLVHEPQGEAICFAPDGNSYYTISEKANQPLYEYTRQRKGILGKP